MDVRTLLDRNKNPFFEHGEAEYFLARRAGAVVGRITAQSNSLHNEIHEDKVGFFGFFECENDQTIADALFDTAAAWLRARGFDTMRGPASFSVNEECGLKVDGFDTPPTIMMPHNPPYYVPLVEHAGFVKAKDLLIYQGGDLTFTAYKPVHERLTRAVNIMQTRMGVTLRPIDMTRFHEEIELVKALYNRSWEKNWGFVPMTDHEIDQLAKQFKPVIVPDLITFAEKDGVPVGFSLAIPDFNVILRTNRQGRLTPWLLIRLFWALKREKLRRCRIPLLGVVPEFRGRGLDSVLYHEVWTKAAKHGIYWGEGGWILEDNPAMNMGLSKMGFVVYQTLRMYDRPL
jgi:GNAT superfamily N-acetyltransferase